MVTYKRVLLKLSGESLMGEQQYGIDSQRLKDYAEQIKEITDLGVQVGIVIGGGNIFRGLSGAAKGFDRVKGDSMGMLATVINALAFQDGLERHDMYVRVMSALHINQISEDYIRRRAVRQRPLHKPRRPPPCPTIPNRRPPRRSVRPTLVNPDRRVSGLPVPAGGRPTFPRRPAGGR